MAAPAYKNFSQATLSDAGTATSPSDTAIGDLVVCIVWSQFTTTATTHTIQTGFTLVRSHSHSDGSTCGRLSVATKVATAAGATTYTPFTIASATAGQTCAAIITVTGADTSNPAGWASNSVTDTSNAAPNPPSVTNLNYDNLVLAIAAWSVTTAGTTSATVMANYTMPVNGPAGSHLTHLAVAYRALTGLNLATEDPAAYTDNVVPNGTAAMTIAIPMAPVARTYYASAGGNDSNNGITTGTSWKTLSPVNAKVMLPGDTFNFNGGDVFSGGIYAHDVASTQASPVTFNSYGTGKATISSAVGTTGVFIYDMGGCVVQNLIVTGPGIATANKDGISFWNDKAGSVVYPYVRITNCTVSGFQNGIAVGGGNGTSGYSDVRITGCNSSNNSKKGIVTYGVFGSNYALANVYIGNCVTTGNTGIAGATEPTGSGIECGSINGGTIEFCAASGNGATNNFASGPIGIWCWECSGVTIQNCESYNNQSNGGDGGGFDLDGGCKNCILQYCYSHGNKGGGLGVFQFDAASTYTGNIVRYNISENDQGGGIAIWADPGDSVTNTQIYNNTVFNNVAPAFRVLPNTTMSGIVASNNILLTGSGASLVDVQNTSGLSFSRNNYFAVSGSFVIWWGGTQYNTVGAWGQDATGLSVNPLLTNPGGAGTVYPAALTTITAYKISSFSSPMIGAGNTITSPGSTDFWGDTLYTAAPDIGADESTLTAAPATKYMPLAPFVIA